MTLTTEQIRALMSAKPRVIGLKPLCDAAGVPYDPLRVRLASKNKKGEYIGSLKDGEGEALGKALADALPDGWTLIFSQIKGLGKDVEK